jgi:peroxiredoxin Q/BCP
VDANRHTVVCFFPQAGSPGCVKEACGFGDHMSALRAAQVRVVGISNASVRELRAMAEQHKIEGFDLLSDPDHVVSAEWGAWHDLGVCRMTFDDHGIVSHHFPRVDVNRHAADLLALLGRAAALKPSEGADATPRLTPAAAQLVEGTTTDHVFAAARASIALLLRPTSPSWPPRWRRDADRRRSRERRPRWDQGGGWLAAPWKFCPENHRWYSP